MTPAGEAAFSQRTQERSLVYAHERAAPAELTHGETAVFRQNAAAWAYFEACPPGYRQRMLHWVVSAKRQATRDARLARLIGACNDGQRID